MEHSYIEEISAHEGHEVIIKGWIFNRRSSGKIHFLMIRDGTGIIQGVVSATDISQELFDTVSTIGRESSVIVQGVIKADKRAPGGYELLIKDISIINSSQPYPITKKEHGIDFLMERRHLWLRSSKQHANLRIRRSVINAAHDLFNKRGFTLFNAPILMPTACEGTTNLFETDYFEKNKAYLSQSGQLYAEAGAMAFGKVYTLGPTFRAEKSKTRRHLTEFWMLEPEVAYADLDNIICLAEDMIKAIITTVLLDRQTELKTLERDTEKLKAANSQFARISYKDAVKIVQETNSSFIYGEDFGALDETVLSNRFSTPLVIHRYPKKIKPFYMKTDPEDNELVLCVDILAPDGYGEIIGGSQREDDYNILTDNIKQHNLDQASLEWYIDLRRYGSVPHSGFGLGIERLVAWICGVKHVRETIPFPRLLERLWP